MKRLSFCCFTLTAICTAIDPTGAAESRSSPDSKPPTYSLDEVRTFLSESLAKVRSIRLAFRTTSTPDREVWVNLQQKRPDSYSVCIRHTRGDVPPQDDPFAIRYVLSENKFSVEKLFNRLQYDFALPSTAELPGSLGGDFWCNATGYWILAKRPCPRIYNVPTSLAGTLEGRPELLEVQSEVGDAWCHVLRQADEDSVTTVYLDLNGPMKLAKKVVEAKKSEQKVTYNFYDHTPIRVEDAELWFPMRIKATFEPKPGVSDVTEIQLDEMKINCVEDAEIAPRSPADGNAAPVSLEEGRGTTRRVEPEHLLKVGTWLRNYYRWDPPSPKGLDAPLRAKYLMIGIILGIVIYGVSRMSLKNIILKTRPLLNRGPADAPTSS